MKTRVARVLAMLMALCMLLSACGQQSVAERPNNGSGENLVQNPQDSQNELPGSQVTDLSATVTNPAVPEKGTYNEGVALVKYDGEMTQQMVDQLGCVSAEPLYAGASWYALTLPADADTVEKVAYLRELGCFEAVDYDYIMKADAEVVDETNVPATTNASDRSSTSHSSHPVCGSSCACTSEFHDAKNWTAWDGTTKLYSGYYYLTGDVVLSSTMNLDYYHETYLCLNGYTISCEDTVFAIYSYSSLTISDCVGTGKIVSDNYATITNNNYLCIYGGTITGSETGTNYHPILSYAGTTVDIYGGSVEGYGIFMHPGATIKIRGGYVSCIGDNGDGTENVSNVWMYGGRLGGDE